MRREILGGDHPVVGQSLNNLGNVLLDRGELDAAEGSHREALAIRRAALGPDHPDVAMSLNNLAVVLMARGCLDEAEKYQQEALDSRRRHFGAEHFLVARGLSNLGQIHERRGDLANAEQCLRGAMDLHERLLGPLHRDVAPGAVYLGSYLLRANRHAEAAAAFEHWATIYEGNRRTSGHGLAPATAMPSYYPELALARLRLDDARRAWEATERHLARLLVDAFLAAKANDPQRDDDAAAIRAQEREAATLREQLAALTSGPIPAHEESEWRRVAEEARIRLLTVEAAVDKLHLKRRRRQQRVSRGAEIEAAVFPLERVQAALGPRTALVGWLDLEPDYGGSEAWGY